MWQVVEVKPKDELLSLPAWQFYGFVAFGGVFSALGGYLGGLTAVLFGNVMTTVAGASALGASTYFDTESGKRSALLGQLTPAFYFEQVLSFMVGAMLAGVIMGPKRKRWEGAQTSTLWAEVVFLWLAWVLFRAGQARLSAFATSAAAGIQNSLTSSLSPIAFRTTHVSGTAVDFGNAFGFMLRDGCTRHAWRTVVWGTSYAGFVGGAFLGAFAALHLDTDAILLIAAVSTAAALGTTVVTVLLGRCSPRGPLPPNFAAAIRFLHLDELYDFAASCLVPGQPHVLMAEPPSHAAQPMPPPPRTTSTAAQVHP